MSARPIRAVLFDLDGTLYDRDAVVAAVTHEQVDTFGSRLGNINREEVIARLLALDDHGYARRVDVYRTLLAGMEVDDALAADLEAHFWDCYCRHCGFPKDAADTLAELRESGLKLALVTNGPVGWQSRKLRTLGLADYFDVVLISEAEGVAKPDPRIFERALERLGVRSDEAIFVGDHPEIDVAGAQDAGLIAVWKRVPYWPLRRADVVVIERLSEIRVLCTASSDDRDQL
jgi:putative hydrolase of the HAD superfamily